MRLIHIENPQGGSLFNFDNLNAIQFIEMGDEYYHVSIHMRGDEEPFSCVVDSTEKLNAILRSFDK